MVELAVLLHSPITSHRLVPSHRVRQSQYLTVHCFGAGPEHIFSHLAQRKQELGVDGVSVGGWPCPGGSGWRGRGKLVTLHGGRGTSLWGGAGLTPHLPWPGGHEGHVRSVGRTTWRVLGTEPCVRGAVERNCPPSPFPPPH